MIGIVSTMGVVKMSIFCAISGLKFGLKIIIL